MHYILGKAYANIIIHIDVLIISYNNHIGHFWMIIEMIELQLHSDNIFN